MKEVRNMPISKETVSSMMRDPDTVVLSVLSEADFAKLHIKGSQNVPWGPNDDEFVKAVGAKFRKERFFITYCADLSCGAGPKAAKALQEKGFMAAEYAGGILEWAQAGLPTEGTQAKEPGTVHMAGLWPETAGSAG